MNKFLSIAVLMLTLGMIAIAETTAPLTSPNTAPVTIGVNELLSAGRVDDALKALDLRLKKTPSDAEAYNLLSRSYFAIQKWDRAIDAGEKAVAFAPNNSEYHMWLGRAYGEKADHSSFVTAAKLTKQIREEFERAVELDASNVSARSDKALREVDAMAQRDVAKTHWLQARIAEKDHKLDAAEAEYKNAIEASGNQGSYWLNLASFYKRQKRLNEMEAAISSAIAADKKRPNVLFDAAQILF
jgi:tetratricopeptide (TPR) repeat protein